MTKGNHNCTAVEDRSWKGVQKMMTDPNKFLAQLKAGFGVLDSGFWGLGLSVEDLGLMV